MTNQPLLFPEKCAHSSIFIPRVANFSSIIFWFMFDYFNQISVFFTVHASCFKWQITLFSFCQAINNPWLWEEFWINVVNFSITIEQVPWSTVSSATEHTDTRPEEPKKLKIKKKVWWVLCERGSKSNCEPYASLKTPILLMRCVCTGGSRSEIESPAQA